MIRGSLVVSRRPKSMSRRAMNRTQFAAAKQAVLQLVAELIGVELGVLLRNAGRIA